MKTATSETESKSCDLSICVQHYTLRAPCPKGQGNGRSAIFGPSHHSHTLQCVLVIRESFTKDYGSRVFHSSPCGPLFLHIEPNQLSLITRTHCTFGPRFLHQCPRWPNGATFGCLDGWSHLWRCSDTSVVWSEVDSK